MLMRIFVESYIVKTFINFKNSMSQEEEKYPLPLDVDPIHGEISDISGNVTVQCNCKKCSSKLEEEKLIEELKMNYWFGEEMMRDPEENEDIRNFILKAYRAGKLAGFEMWENGLLWQVRTAKTLGLPEKEIKSLIEEEKKKL